MAPADFTVEVDGRPVQISDVAHADDPAQVAVVFNFKQPDGIGALAAAVLGGNPRSSVAVARTFANDGNAGWGRLPDLPPFSSDLKVIEAGLAAQRDRERGNSDARVPPSPVGLLTDVCRALAAIHATRPNIVFFLDQAHDPGGLMSVSLSEPVRSGPDAADDLQRTLSSSFAAIWTIATPRQPISEKASEIAPEFAPFSESYRFMSTISPASGGAVLTSGTSASDTTAAFTRVGAAIASQYRLTFKAASSAGFKVRVKVRRDGVHVFAPGHVNSR